MLFRLLVLGHCAWQPHRIRIRSNSFCSRPDVAESRIGLTGHSGGGTQTIMLMAAAGDRFAAAAPCAYVTDNQAMMDTALEYKFR